MFSDTAKRTADACRFCWMCRHICPVASNTGNEAHTPRAKGLLISLVERGSSFNAETAEVMYQCCLCNACANDCVTGFRPELYIREARTQAVVEDCVPARVQPLLDRVLEEGNLYGFPVGDKMNRFADVVSGLPEQADVLLYIGETAAFRSPETAFAAMSLLKKAGVSYTVSRREPPSGADLADLFGYTEEVRSLAAKTAEIFDNIRASTVVVLDPRDADIFKQEYPGWGIELPGSVTTATAFFAELVRAGKLFPKQTAGTVTYHDPCKLARGLDEEEPARELLAAMGLSVKEMFRNRKNTKCCGGEILGEHSPETALRIAQERILDAKNTGTGALVVACPGCANAFKSFADAEIKVRNLFCMLDECC